MSITAQHRGGITLREMYQFEVCLCMSSNSLAYMRCEVTQVCFCVTCNYCGAGCCPSRCWQAAWHHQHMWHYGRHSWQHCDRQYCCVSRRLSSSVCSYQWRLPQFVCCMANLGEWPQHYTGQAAVGELTISAGFSQHLLNLMAATAALSRMPLLASKDCNTVNA